MRSRMKKITVTTLLLAAGLLLIPALAGAGRPQLYQERMEVGRALLEVQSTNVAAVLPYYTDDIEYHDPIVDIYGIEEMTAFLFQLFGSSPDLVTTSRTRRWSRASTRRPGPWSASSSASPTRPRASRSSSSAQKSAQVYYQRDYYSEGDIMATIPGLDVAITGFRTFYRCAVDPTFDCPLDGPPTAAEPGLRRPDNRPGGQGRDNRLRSRSSCAARRWRSVAQLVEINAANWQPCCPTTGQNYEYHDPIVDIYGPEPWCEFFARLFAASSDL